MSDPAIASAELREVAEGQLGERKDLYPLAPYLEGEPLRRYVKLKNLYPKIRKRDQRKGDATLPGSFENTKYCKRLVAAHGSEAAAKAVRTGDLSTLSYFTGLTQQSTNFSTAQQLTELLNLTRQEGYLAVFVGDTNAGKTNTALLKASLTLLDNPEMQFVTNLKTVEWNKENLNKRTHFVDKRSELDELAEQHEDLFVVLDEMSKEANAQTSNYEVNEHLYPLITHKSKRGLRLVIVGHRSSGNDIAPAIREHATHFVTQNREVNLDEKIYTASFFGAIVDGEPEDHKFDLSPIPKVAATYDPDEETSFNITG